MKTIFRFFGSTALLAGLVAAGSLGVFAQDAPAPDPCDLDAANAVYRKFTDNIKSTSLEGQKLAVAGGEEYVKKYEACEQFKVQVTYIKDYLPSLKKWIVEEEARQKKAALFTAFDNSIQASKWDESFSVGKQLLALEPDNLNILLVLGSIGSAETGKTPRNTKYNADSIMYAKSVIQKIGEGKTSQNYGAFQFSYVNKENAVSWMNYGIGMMMYFGQNNKKEALGYFYKATQSGTTKDLPQIYGIIGDYYFDEVKRLGEEIKVKTEAAGNKDTDETIALVAQLKGYAERATDAYTRAINLVKDPKAAKYKEGLVSARQTMYKLRFQKETGVNEFVAAQVSKPFPDPTTVPTPIVEADPADAPAAKPATQGSTPAAAPASGAKPATTPATNGTKPAATPATKKPVSTTGAASANSTAKKPAAKKKGTR